MGFFDSVLKFFGQSASRAEAAPPLSGSAFIEDFLTVVISKEQVASGNVAEPANILKALLESPETARRFAERVDVAFHGYDHVPEELFEIAEVRAFVTKLDALFPYWLFFLSKQHLGLQCLMLCFMPPHLTEEARARIYPQRLADLLTRRWIPAMNHACSYAGFSEGEIQTLTDRMEAYVTKRPLK